MVPRGGFDPPTQRFSVFCSTGLSYLDKVVVTVGFDPTACRLSTDCSTGLSYVTKYNGQGSAWMFLALYR